MNWKSFLKRILVIGVLLIPLNLFYELFSVYLFYKVILLKDIILLAGISLLAAVSIFRFVYRRAENFRAIQSIATILLSELIAYVLSIALTILIFTVIS